jgi:hypothetical protein
MALLTVKQTLYISREELAAHGVTPKDTWKQSRNTAYYWVPEKDWRKFPDSILKYVDVLRAHNPAPPTEESVRYYSAPPPAEAS